MPSSELIDTTQNSILTDWTSQQFVRDFLAGRKETTRKAYSQAIRDCAKFIGAATVPEAMRILLSNGRGYAATVVLRYKANMVERDLAANTINARLSAIRAAVKLAKELGLVDWSVGVRNVKATKYRDTRGPGCDAVRQMFARLQGSTKRKDVRDLALIRLLHDLGLRRGEVVSLNVADVDITAKIVAVIGKGETDAITMTLPDATAMAISNWLDVRGDDDGPLFTNVDRARKGCRLTGRSVARIVTKLGGDAGLTVRPHGIRHTAITTALDRTNGDIRAVQRFSRHADPRTLLHYDDNREDLAGHVARLVAQEPTTNEQPKATD